MNTTLIFVIGLLVGVAIGVVSMGFLNMIRGDASE